MADSESKKQDVSSNNVEKATFAGGCFWCMQPPYDTLPGVIGVEVGYTGGEKENPSYEEICAGKTGHAEAVEILFNPEQVNYEDLLDIFWRNIDPTTLNRQFADVGTQYRTAIYYHNEKQKQLAEVSKAQLEKSGKFGTSIVTEITSASIFYKAEEYHQKYYKKSPLRYKMYKRGSGREDYIKKTWGDH